MRITRATPHFGLVDERQQEGSPAAAVSVWVCPEAAGELRSGPAFDCLSAAERARAAALASKEAERRFVAAHALNRRALAIELSVSPREIEFDVDARGRPHLGGALAEAGVDFNLSHAPGLVACAIGRAARVGVDVEHAKRAPNLGVAERFFAREELAALHALAPRRRAERFYQLWTLKEAFSKATGLGLALPLASVTFHFEGEQGLRSEFVDPGEHAHGWQFALYRASSAHWLGLAVGQLPGRPPAQAVRVRAQRWEECTERVRARARAVEHQACARRSG